MWSGCEQYECVCTSVSMRGWFTESRENLTDSIRWTLQSAVLLMSERVLTKCVVFCIRVHESYIYHVICVSFDA